MCGGLSITGARRLLGSSCGLLSATYNGEWPRWRVHLAPLPNVACAAGAALAPMAKEKEKTATNQTREP